MAVKNPKKQFNFRVSIPHANTLPVFSVQEATLPDLEVTPDEHGEGNIVKKTAGLVTIGVCTLSRIQPSTGVDVGLIGKFFWNWLATAQDNMSGGGQDEAIYKHNVIIHEMDVTGTVVVNSFILIDAWPSKINGKSYKRGESGNVVEEIELSVDNISLL